MHDVCALLEDTPGALAPLGDALGAAGVSLEGGGMFVHGGTGVAHFLVEDGTAAPEALMRQGIQVVSVRDVVTLRLRQDVPGQLGSACRRMAEAGVNIETLYSDHDGNLILVVDDEPAAREVARDWAADAA